MANDEPAGRVLKRYEMVLRSVHDIVSSRNVKEFCIGITGGPSQRRSAYSRWCRQRKVNLQGFVMLDWEISGEEALKFEEWLFYKTKIHKKYINREHVKYFRNVSKIQSQYIYVAWWDAPINKKFDLR